MQKELHLPVKISLFYLSGSALCLALILTLFAWDPLHSIFSVYFYRGLVYIVLCCLLTAVILYAVTYRLRTRFPAFSLAHPFCVVSCSLFLWAGFFGIIPVSWDRSISVFTLAWMYHHPQPLTKEGMTDNFWRVYVNEYDMFERRIHEQLVTGNIEPVPGTSPQAYVLTPRGRSFIESSTLGARLFSADPRYLLDHEALRGHQHVAADPDHSTEQERSKDKAKEPETVSLSNSALN